jgi:hypothetical protein
LGGDSSKHWTTREILQWQMTNSTPVTPSTSGGEQVVVDGIDDVKRLVTQVRHAFPDVCCRIDDQVVEGDKLVQLTRVNGTHRGRVFLGGPGAESPIAVDLVGLFRANPDAKILGRCGGNQTHHRSLAAGPGHRG